MHELAAEKPWTVYLFVSLAFLFGVIISGLVGSNGSDSQSSKEPKTVVETKTVTKVETERVTKAPKSCKTALKHADTLSEKHKQMERIAGYAVSYATGYNNGSELAESERLAAELVDEIKAVESDYDKSAKECRNDSK